MTDAPIGKIPFAHSKMYTFLRTYAPEITLILIALLLRLPRLNGPFEYDEIWSLEHFAKIPLVNTITGFNHMLNSLWMKLVHSGNTPAWAYRLLSLTCGMGSVWLFWLLGRMQSKTAGRLMLVFAAFSLPLITYAQTARGYSPQLFCLMLFSVGLIAMEQKKVWAAYMMAIAGILAECAVITSVLPLFILALYSLIRQLRAHTCTRHNWYGFLILGCFTFIWYITHWNVIFSARHFGVALHPDVSFFSWWNELLQALGIFLPLLLFAACYARKKRDWLLLAFIFLIPATGLITRGGPPRTLLILLPAAALILTDAAIRFIGQVQWRMWFCGALMVLSQYGAWAHHEWARPDFYAIAAELQSLPKNILWSVPANTSYPLGWNNRPAIMRDMLERILHPKSGTMNLLLVDGILQGVDQRNNTVTIPLSRPGKAIQGEHLSGQLFQLAPLTREAQSGDLLFLELQPVPEESTRLFRQKITQYNPVKLNAWLTFVVFDKQKKPLRYALTVIRVPQGDAKDLIELQEKLGNKLRIYSFAE